MRIRTDAEISKHVDGRILELSVVDRFVPVQVSDPESLQDHLGSEKCTRQREDEARMQNGSVDIRELIQRITNIIQVEFIYIVRDFFHVGGAEHAIKLRTKVGEER